MDARKGLPMKRSVLYMRVSTLDQHPETQLYDLHEMAKQRGYEIVEEYTDMISGARARRPGLDAMMQDAPPRPIRCRPGLGL
jgi:DNA invertase Pin-like site-specific DNA recombinase